MARRTSPEIAKGKLNLLGPKLRALREGAGLRQVELAYRLQRVGWDIDPVTMNRVELGHRTLTDIELLLILRVLRRRLSDLEGRPTTAISARAKRAPSKREARGKGPASA